MANGGLLIWRMADALGIQKRALSGRRGKPMNFQKILEQIRSVKPEVVVIGEQIRDLWYYGRYTKQSQETPDLKVFVESEDTAEYNQPGGAAGTYHNLCRLYGEYPHEKHSRISFLSPTGANLVTVKTRFYDTEEKQIVFRYDCDSTYSPLAVDRVPSNKSIIISDYGKGLLNWSVLAEIAEKTKGRKVIFSPHLVNCGKFVSAKGFQDWVWVFNREEYTHLSPRGLFRDKFTPIQIIMTDSSKAVLLSNNPEFPVTPIQTPHTVAIGDCFLAGFSAAHLSGVEIADSIRFAIELCRRVLVSGRLGSCLVNLEDLK